jgi:hypothetical protein
MYNGIGDHVDESEKGKQPVPAKKPVPKSETTAKPAAVKAPGKQPSK